MSWKDDEALKRMQKRTEPTTVTETNIMTDPKEPTTKQIQDWVNDHPDTFGRNVDLVIILLKRLEAAEQTIVERDEMYAIGINTARNELEAAEANASLNRAMEVTERERADKAEEQLDSIRLYLRPLQDAFADMEAIVEGKS